MEWDAFDLQSQGSWKKDKCCSGLAEREEFVMASQITFPGIKQLTYKMPLPNPYSSLISTAKLFRPDRRRKAEWPHNLLSWGESLYDRAFETRKSMAKLFPEGANFISQTLKQVHMREGPREPKKKW